MRRTPRTGDYRLRVQVLPRKLAARGANGEEAESWPREGREYSAAQDQMSAGEVMVQGLRQTTGAMRIRIKGVAIPVTALDRVKVVQTGLVYNVTAQPVRETYDTVLSLELAAGAQEQPR